MLNWVTRANTTEVKIMLSWIISANTVEVKTDAKLDKMS